MSDVTMFASSVRSAGDVGGVFEYDGEVGYFYLYGPTRPEGQEVLGAIRIASAPPGFGEKDVAIRWASTESLVGLFVMGRLCAAFDGNTGEPFGGNCSPNAMPAVPTHVVRAFEVTAP